MNRRGFLQSILAAGVAPAFVGSGVLMPIRALLPALHPSLRLIEEATENSIPVVVRGNMLTPSIITAEALRILENQITKSHSINAKWDPEFRRVYHAMGLTGLNDAVESWTTRLPDRSSGNIRGVIHGG
jgi:hypothetical protein